MTFFRNVVFVAAIAGLLAGIVMTAMQTYATVPLILKAETFENSAGAAEPHNHDAAPGGSTATSEATPPAAHTHDADESWAPADGFERFADMQVFFGIDQPTCGPFRGFLVRWDWS